MNKMDVTDIKSNNVKEILDVMRRHDSMTKRDVMRYTDLSFATISNICNDLRERRVLYGYKSGELTVGRNPDMIRFDADRKLAICLDLQIQGILRLAIVNFRGEVVYNTEQPHSPSFTPEEVVCFAKTIFDRSRSELSLSDSEFVGVGVAVAAIFDTRDNKLISCAIPIYEGCCLKQITQDAFNLPAYVDNESNICAIAVHSMNNGNENVVYLDVSEGVGVGVVSHGRLLRGKNGYAAEIGHIPIGDSSKRCPVCGCCGCIENDLSIGGILAQYHGSPYEGDAMQGWQELVEHVTSGKPKALEAANWCGRLLGELAAMLINLFDPDVFYIGGLVADLLPSINAAISEVERRCVLSTSRGLKIHFDPQSRGTINLGLGEAVYRNWNPLG